MTEPTARTRPGGDLVALAEWLGAEGAGLRDLREAGYLAAPVQIELGGLGVRSVHDLALAASRLARADAALAAEATEHWIRLLADELRARFRAAVELGRAEAAS